jgi:hypothetical protein
LEICGDFVMENIEGIWIWIKRCDEVAEIEKERGINSKNKRKKKKRTEDDVVGMLIENQEKSKKNKWK